MTTTAKRRGWALLLLGILALPLSGLAEGPSVVILQSPEAPDLEKVAAEELSGILEKLFDADVSTRAEPSGEDQNIILLGNKETNPAIEEVAGDAWPSDLGEQDHLLRSLDRDGRNVLLVGGGSPIATLWATYELGHHFGMRYTLHEDFLPVEMPQFTLTGIDIILRPNVEKRAWRILEPGLAGMESWGLESHRKLLRQLRKLKFNWLASTTRNPEQFSQAGIDVSGDRAGRAVFAGEKTFDNPDLAEASDSADRKESGEKLIGRIQSEALDLGFSTVTVPYEGESPGIRTIHLSQPQGGVLPQFFTGRLPGELDSVREESSIEGFAVRCWIPGNLNQDIYFLSRASFNADLTPRQALDELITPICGEGVSERLANGFAAIEEISRLIEAEDPDFSIPDPKMFVRHLESTDEAPEWWGKATELYGTAVNEMYRGNTRARGGARPFILYHAKYFTFALHYMTAVQSARDAARAKDADDTEAYVEHLEAAVEAMHNALQIYADVARDNSDRGVIAVLNEYGYLPLLEALNEAPLP